jgi:hypothetical protein
MIENVAAMEKYSDLVIQSLEAMSMQSESLAANTANNHTKCKKNTFHHIPLYRDIVKSGVRLVCNMTNQAASFC